MADWVLATNGRIPVTDFGAGGLRFPRGWVTRGFTTEAEILAGPDHSDHAGRVVAVVVDPVVFEKLLQDAADALDRAELAIARDEDDYIPWEQVKVDLGLS